MNKRFHANTGGLSRFYIAHRLQNFVWHSGQAISTRDLYLPSDFFGQKEFSARIVKSLFLTQLPANLDNDKFKQFVNLKHLELDLDLNRASFKLTSQSLLSFACHKPNKVCPLTIDCPHLAILKYNEVSVENRNLLDNKKRSLLIIQNSKSIEQLHTNLPTKTVLRIGFRSLKKFRTDNFDVFSSPSILASFKHLQELKFTGSLSVAISRLQVILENLPKTNSEKQASSASNAVNQLKEIARQFLAKVKRAHRGESLCVIFAGFRLKELKLDRINFTDSHLISAEEFYTNNFDLLQKGDLCHLTEFNYYDIQLNRKSLAEFLPKLDRVWSVTVRSFVKPDDFKFFLSNLKSTKRLFVQNAALDQTFFNQLPQAVPALYKLEIEWFSKFDLDFSFVKNLSRRTCSSLFGVDRVLNPVD